MYVYECRYYVQLILAYHPSLRFSETIIFLKLQIHPISRAIFKKIKQVALVIFSWQNLVGGFWSRGIPTIPPKENESCFIKRKSNQTFNQWEFLTWNPGGTVGINCNLNFYIIYVYTHSIVNFLLHFKTTSKNLRYCFKKKMMTRSSSPFIVFPQLPSIDKAWSDPG